MEMVKVLNSEFKKKYLMLIASGHTERTALQTLDVEWIDFFELCSKDEKFRKEIDDARRSRADRWVDGIADSLSQEYTIRGPDGTEFVRPPTKDENARDKLKFEKMKFLAQADNPDKYGQSAGKKQIDIDIDLTKFQLLSPQESIQVLNSDPFNKMVTIDVTPIEPEEKK